MRRYLFSSEGTNLSDSSCRTVIVFLLQGDVAFKCLCGLDPLQRKYMKYYYISGAYSAAVTPLFVTVVSMI